MNSMYFEKLPEGECPPLDAVDVDLGRVWRLVPSLPVLDEHFASHAALGKHNYSSDPCRWASCSLFTTEQAALSITKLPKHKQKTVVALYVPKGAGKSKTVKKHVDFWRYSSFKPLQALI